jgi:hypothetical protein
MPPPFFIVGLEPAPSCVFASLRLYAPRCGIAKHHVGKICRPAKGDAPWAATGSFTDKTS